MTLYYPVQDKTTTRPVNTQNYGHWSFRPITISAHDHFGPSPFRPIPFRPITCMSKNYDLVIELCDQIAKFNFHTPCYTHQINFLQYLALRILFAMWVMYSLGHLLWPQDTLWLMIINVHIKKITLFKIHLDLLII